MPKPRGRRPPAPKRFRVMVDNQSRDVTCLTDVGDLLRHAFFRTGASSVTVMKLKKRIAIDGEATRDPVA